MTWDLAPPRTDADASMRSVLGLRACMQDDAPLMLWQRVRGAGNGRGRACMWPHAADARATTCCKVGLALASLLQRQSVRARVRKQMVAPLMAL